MTGAQFPGGGPQEGDTMEVLGGDSRVVSFARALRSLQGLSTEIYDVENWRVAEAIVSHPQAHIDALVEAGVLVQCVHQNVDANAYVVCVLVHEHDWRIIYVDKRQTGALVRIGCECSLEITVEPNDGLLPEYRGEVPLL